MKKSNLLFLLLLLMIACQNKSVDPKESWTPETSPFRPNIVWLVAEDLSHYIPPFGDSTIQTPHLSRLAEEGVRYTNLFSVAGVCSPSRAALCTGMYPSSVGAQNMRTQYNADMLAQVGLIPYEVVLPPAVKMMSQVMRENGYYATNNDKTDYQFVPSTTAWDDNGPVAHWRNRPAGKPFFSIFNFNVTHESQVFGTTSKKALRFKEGFPQDLSKEPKPDWAGGLDSSDWTLAVPEDLAVKVPPYLVEDEGTMADIRRVYSNIAIMDQQVGFLVKQLEEDGLLDSTIIVWYTDHGGPLPRQKRLLYDSGLRVPMIIRYPEKWNAGTIDNQLISFVDFAPTTFSMASIEPPAYLQGQAVIGPYKQKPRSYIHAAADRLDSEIDMIRAVSDGRYKYLRNFQPNRGYYLAVEYRERMNSMKSLLKGRDAGTLNEYQAQWFRPNKAPEELFDTQLDPHELNNLAADPAYAEKLAELRTECDRWMAAISDKGHIPEAEMLENFWPNRVQPITATPVISNEGNKVSLSCPTDGANLGYKIMTNGKEPPAWTPYTEPFEGPKAGELKVIAHRIGYKPSAAGAK